MHLPALGFSASFTRRRLSAGGPRPPRRQRDDAQAPLVKPREQQRAEINIPPAILRWLQSQMLPLKRLADMDKLTIPLDRSARLDLAYDPSVRIRLGRIA